MRVTATPVLAWLAIMLIGPSVAAQPADGPPQEKAASAADIAFFESKIRPVLVEHCYDCHSAQSGVAEGGLRVDSRQALRRGGDQGPAVVPGDPDASWLIIAITHSDPDLKMPPKQPPLPADVIADFKKWIQSGAADPRDEVATEAAQLWDASRALQHWAYQPLKSSPPAGATELQAAASYSDWPRTDIDRFILSQLAKHGLAPSADAAPETLLRRLHFDLVGLPPTPADLQRFEQSIHNSGLDVALESEVDRLLASPQFGERWGRHWLDVARFGESSGKEANISFPYAWRYRDYVIDAFNDDVPYDRFLHEQIAGDLLSAADDFERARLLIATGFLALGPKNLDEANQWQFLADLIDEQIDSVTQAVMASTVACARCHDHKFDPFSMQDYYALAGVFASTQTFFGTAVSPANRIGGEPLPLPLEAGHPILHASISAEKVKQLRAELAEMQQRKQEKLTLTEALGIFWKSGGIRGQLAKVSDTGEALPLAMGVLERDQIIDVPLLQRGDIGKPGDRVPRALPAAIQLDPPVRMPSDQSGRLELAQWLTHPQHPLTSRVIVNRLWSHLFGAGLVQSIDNFGTTGEAPSHPELLDHLALQFMQNHWSIKQLIREMVLSRTYRQASDYNEHAFQIDPDNRLLWRVPKRRLQAEAIRDAMLAVSGELDLTRPTGSLVGSVIGDRPMSLIGLDKRLPSDLDGSVHRSVYLPVIRDRLPDVLDLFDFAEPSLVSGQRETTNVPIQALYLMNSEFVQDRAEALAMRLLQTADNGHDRIELAFQWCFNRPPDSNEQQRSLEFLSRAGSTHNGENPTPDHTAEPVPAIWSQFAQALLSTAEFRNLD